MPAPFGPFSTADMLDVVQIVKRPNTGLLSRYFGQINTSDNEHISFDVDEQKRYLAPFVSPLATAPTKATRGQQVKTFNPAYIKQRAIFRPSRGFTRAAGESFATPLSPEQRINLAMAAEVVDQVAGVDRRLESMAIEAVVHGRVTVSGEDYPSTVVSFGRDASLSLAANTKGAGARWTDAAVDPLDDIENLSLASAQLAGTTTPDIICELTAFRALRKNPQTEKKLDLRNNAGTAMGTNTPQGEGLMFRGTLDGYNIWTYVGWYIDENGVEQPSLPTGLVLGMGDVAGVQHFGAIQDLDAGLAAMPIFPDSYTQKEPSALWLRTQSAPLVVKRRPNASWAAKVTA